MRQESASKGIDVDDLLSADITTLMEDEANQSDVTQCMKLFWEQSKENAARSKYARRYPSMIIRFSLT